MMSSLRQFGMNANPVCHKSATRGMCLSTSWINMLQLLLPCILLRYFSLKGPLSSMYLSFCEVKTLVSTSSSTANSQKSAKSSCTVDCMSGKAFRMRSGCFCRYFLTNMPLLAAFQPFIISVCTGIAVKVVVVEQAR